MCKFCFLYVPYAFKKPFITVKAPIMISPNKILPSVKPTQKIFGSFSISKAKVAKMVYKILTPYRAIPQLYKPFVVTLNYFLFRTRFKLLHRNAAQLPTFRVKVELTDVGKMNVTYEKNFVFCCHDTNIRIKKIKAKILRLIFQLAVGFFQICRKTNYFSGSGCPSV